VKAIQFIARGSGGNRRASRAGAVSEFATVAVFDDANVLLQAALEGQGIALGFLPLIADEIAAGRLVQPWKEAVQPAESYYLLYHRNTITRDPVSRVRDWLLTIAG
jgi:LysR family glycine cleavage system transcriptional activator